jgi:hypothetical protein
MTTFTMRYIKGHFVVTGSDVPPMQFKSRAEARDWCKTHYPGSPIKEENGPGVHPSLRGMTLSPDDPLAKAPGKRSRRNRSLTRELTQRREH